MNDVLTSIKRVPLPMSGLALGIAALGLNLDVAIPANFGINIPAVKTGCGIVAGVFLLLVLLHLIVFHDKTRLELHDVVTRSVFPTFFMACMNLSTYLELSMGYAAFWFWLAALTLQLLWVAWFIAEFIIKSFNIRDVYPTWFVVLVGFVAGASTSTTFGMGKFGVVLLGIGLVAYVSTATLVIYRLAKYPDIPRQFLPTFAIMAAPPNLTLAAHMNLVKANVMGFQPWIVYPLLVCSVLGFLYAVIRCAPIAFRRFYPGFAAFTFPAVITSTAYTDLSIQRWPQLAPVAFILQVFAIIMVIYVQIRYTIYLFPLEPKHHVSEPPQDLPPEIRKVEGV